MICCIDDSDAAGMVRAPGLGKTSITVRVPQLLLPHSVLLDPGKTKFLPVLPTTASLHRCIFWQQYNQRDVNFAWSCVYIYITGIKMQAFNLKVHEIITWIRFLG